MPDAAEMVTDVVQSTEERQARFTASRRHTIQVDWIPFMEELAALIGASPPSFTELLFTDPKLAVALYTGPVLPYTYRLRGPHSWPHARDTILSLMDRVRAPLGSKKADMMQDSPEAVSFRIVLILLLVTVIWFWFW